MSCASFVIIAIFNCLDVDSADDDMDEAMEDVEEGHIDAAGSIAAGPSPSTEAAPKKKSNPRAQKTTATTTTPPATLPTSTAQAPPISQLASGSLAESPSTLTTLVVNALPTEAVGDASKVSLPLPVILGSTTDVCYFYHLCPFFNVSGVSLPPFVL